MPDILDGDDGLEVPPEAVADEGGFDLDAPRRAADGEGKRVGEGWNERVGAGTEGDLPFMDEAFIGFVFGQADVVERVGVERAPSVAGDLDVAVDVGQADPAGEELLDREVDVGAGQPGAGGKGVDRLGIDERAVEVEDHGPERMGFGHGPSVAAARRANPVHSPAMRHAIFFDLDVTAHGSQVPFAGPALLSPLTDLRAAFDVRTGVVTTLERWSRAVRVIGAIVPEPLAALTRERHAFAVNDGLALAHGGPDDVLLVNGRCPLAIAEAMNLALGTAIVERATGHVIAWRTTIDKARAIAGGERIGADAVDLVDRHVLLTRPWHVRTLRDSCIAADLEVLAATPSAIPPGVTPIGGHPIHIEPSARVYPTVVLDAEQGPIWIGPHAVVRPGAILIGPCAIGEHSTVLDRTLIKGQTAIGPHCKVAGEVGGTIFQGFSNKAHDGHLGDSWLGEWVNLGAGTTNSNLLNTYAEVIARATPGGFNERTGETFLGTIIGDHVKMAISTRIMTGSVVGTGTMWAATKPLGGTVAPFSWVTDAGERAYRFEKFMEVAKAAMGRRKIVPSEAFEARLKALNAEGR